MIRNFEPFTIGDINSDDWQNPKKTGKNTVAPHSYFVPFENEEKALENNRFNSEYRISLNGEWSFSYYDSYCKMPFDFYSADFDDSNWDTLAVPSNWRQMAMISRSMLMQITQYRLIRRLFRVIIPWDYTERQFTVLNHQGKSQF